jgi:hypothetical protein
VLSLARRCPREPKPVSPALSSAGRKASASSTRFDILEYQKNINATIELASSLKNTIVVFLNNLVALRDALLNN